MILFLLRFPIWTDWGEVVSLKLLIEYVKNNKRSPENILVLEMDNEVTRHVNISFII